MLGVLSQSLAISVRGYSRRAYIARKCAFVGVLTLFCAPDLLAQSFTGSIPSLSVDFAHFSTDRKLTQDVYFSVAGPASGLLRFECYRYNSDGDSLLVYGKKGAPLTLKTGICSIPVSFGYNDSGSYVHPDFFQILKRYATVPAGTYRWFGLFTPDSGSAFQAAVSLQADSALSPASPLFRDLSSKLEQPTASASGFFGTAKTVVVSSLPAAKALDQASGRIGKMMKARGLEPRIVHKGAQSEVQLWYGAWFIGSYRLEAGKGIGSQLQQQKAKAAGSLSSLASTGLESYRSLTSQVRELNRSSKAEKELQGAVALTGNWANGQPEYSAEDNNYYEVRAGVQTEVADIPVSIDGYYTTQDARRQVKASYIHFQYDAERAKEKLLKLIDGYKRKYSETVSQGAGMSQVYGSYLGNLGAQKDALIAGLSREAGMSAPAVGAFSLDTAALRAQLEANLREKLADTALLDSAGSKLDSAGRMRAAAAQGARIKDSTAKLYAAAMQRYEQVKALEAQYNKYQGLLEQYRRTSYFDSALAYDKIRDLERGDATTYKQLAKSASGLLPEGKAKKLITGLTSFDAGMFPKYVSKYTLGGQQLKGMDLGYDIGFAQVGLTLGQTEFAGRDGSLDKYSTYSGRIEVQPGKNQKLGLIYYGYTPSRSLLSGDDTFSKAIDMALPSFREPVHIISAQYEGTFFDNVRVEAEGASSARKGSGQTLANGFDADRLAWRVAGEGRIPGTSLELTGSYEHGGKRFENGTMPLMIAGCELMKAGVKGRFFRDFLSAGVEFNRMEQANLYGTGGNNRWGFQIATHSKRYPSVSLSYKPFATFRNLSDTLAVPQRPVMGEVWTGRASYQIKRKGGVVYRFSAVLNRSISKTDSLASGSDLLQLNASYAKESIMLSLSGGQSALNNGQSGAASGDTLNAAHVRTTFLMISGAYSLKSGLGLSGGIDLGRAYYGLSRWGLNAGLSYRFAKAPLSLRAAGRYGAYRLPAYSGEIRYDRPEGTDAAAPMSWRRLVSGSLELGWTFKQKLNH